MRKTMRALALAFGAMLQGATVTAANHGAINASTSNDESQAIGLVAAGCDASGRNEDALQLMQWMTEPLDYEQVNPVALAAAVTRLGHKQAGEVMAAVGRGEIASEAVLRAVADADGDHLWALIDVDAGLARRIGAPFASKLLI